MNLRLLARSTAPRKSRQYRMSRSMSPRPMASLTMRFCNSSGKMRMPTVTTTSRTMSACQRTFFSSTHE
ncbi:hypothetical protein DSECCO2_570630 [anaerobic digester metagenome]